MNEFAGYRISEKISDSGKSLIYRALDDGGTSVILKVLRAVKPSPSDIARFRHEFELLKGLNVEEVIGTRDIVRDGDFIGIVLEDFNGQQLKDLIGTPWLTMDRTLAIAVKIARALGEIHHRNIVHRDIKPQNILVNVETGQVKLTDFGISSVISSGESDMYSRSYIEGTLTYMSPEQTGRMNRYVDYRTDLYSFGVTLYEMLTGVPPFISEDPLAIIHAHMARVAPSPRALNPEVSAVLSDITMKLLEKTAERRYQNAFGLEADLATCLSVYRETGAIPLFTIGLKDISEKFNIPQQLFGRETEVRRLLDAFESAAAGGRRLVMVSGMPGIGKTAVINEMQKPVMSRRGYFIIGKYDQFKKDVPFSGIIQALQSMMRQILTESPECIERWKGLIQYAVGGNGRIITDAIPEVAHLIGEQLPVQEIGPEETQNRFLMVFRRFIGVFAGETHPLVIFLDDLQWADTASIRVVGDIVMEREFHHIMLVCSYRDAEVDAGHCLATTLAGIRRAGADYDSIEIRALSLDNVDDILASTLKCGRDVTMPLADLIHRKTSGNPFFVIQFIKNLYDSKMLMYRPAEGWHWDMAAIMEMEVSDNVVELMARKLSGLSPRTQDVLKIGACIGNRFSLEVVSPVIGKPVDDILADLGEALDKGLVYYFDGMYRFLHDRIQEAIYSLIPDGDKPGYHYRIGSLVLAETGEAEIKDKIFYIVNHLNMGLELAGGADERDRLVRLNMIAGRKAKASTAYAAANKYFGAALGLLPADRWQSRYGDALELSLEIAMCEHLSSNFRDAERLFDELLRNVRSVEDRARVYNVQLIMAAAAAKHREAVRLGREALALLGFSIPEKASMLDVARGIVSTKILLRGKKDGDILGLPPLTDGRIELVFRIMNNMFWSMYFFNPELMMVMVMKEIMLTVRHGHSRYSAVFFVVYGMLCTIIEDYEAAKRFDSIAERLNRKYPNPENLSKVMVFRSGILSWTRHVSHTVTMIHEALAIAFENGDLNNAIYMIQGIQIMGLFAELPPDVIVESCDAYTGFLERMGDYGAVNSIRSSRQMARCLMGLTAGPASFDEEGFSDAEHVRRMIEDDIPIVLHRHYLLQMRIRCMMGDFRAAVEAGKRSRKLMKYSVGIIVVSEYYYYMALSLLGLHAKAGRLPLVGWGATVRKCRGKLRTLAKTNPDSFSHKLMLVEAGIARARGRVMDAVRLYDAAAEAAEAKSFILSAAMAHEQGGRLLLSEGAMKGGKHHLMDALYSCERIGAGGKARALIGEFPFLEIGAAAKTEERPRRGTTVMLSQSSSSGVSDRLDVDTILKASHAISGEIRLEMLLEKMMSIVLENAGAQRGVFLIDIDGSLFVKAVGDADSGSIATGISERSEDSSGISRAVVNLVRRTREYMVVNDAMSDGSLSGDEYIKRTKPRSILCLPVVHQGRLTAILYLENNLAAGAFTPDRVELLQMLSSQIAISIDNARLYENLEAKVLERTEQLQRSLEEVQSLKNQQDGDYFLTGLILEPLGVNHASSPAVAIDFFVKEKKEFRFRRWQKEIGGDICVSRTLRLRGREYAVFVNADAMGKSIQGAGGALVFGAVFRNILERTARMPQLADRTPEEWMIAACVELQYVFEGFDCSMLVSMVLGMVDAGAGTLYLLNVEHPFTVLYRDGAASFIEKEAASRKLGMPGFVAPSAESIVNVPLRRGDVVIAGSDGRDEILLKSFQARTINEDETLILRCVERGGGDLQSVVRELRDQGELTDDLTLVRIEYRG